MINTIRNDDHQVILAFFGFIIFCTFLGTQYPELFILEVFIIIVTVGSLYYLDCPRGFYYWAVFIIGLSLVFQTTLITTQLIGSDVHNEAFYANLSLSNGWNINIVDPQNTSAVNTVLVPLMAFLTRTPVI